MHADAERCDNRSLLHKLLMAKLPTPALPGSGFKVTWSCNLPQSQPRMPSAPLFLCPDIVYRICAVLSRHFVVTVRSTFFFYFKVDIQHRK